MVIPYYGALNAFLAIYNAIPFEMRAFIVASLLVGGGSCLIIEVKNL